jgi:hypothetical protein
MKRSMEGENGDQDGISCTEEDIRILWIQERPPRQIAAETGESIETTYRILARFQKGLIERNGVESYARRKSREGGTRLATS